MPCGCNTLLIVLSQQHSSVICKTFDIQDSCKSEKREIDLLLLLFGMPFLSFLGLSRGGEFPFGCISHCIEDSVMFSALLSCLCCIFFMSLLNSKVFGMCKSISLILLTAQGKRRFQ